MKKALLPDSNIQFEESESGSMDSFENTKKRKNLNRLKRHPTPKDWMPCMAKAGKTDSYFRSVIFLLNFTSPACSM